MREVRGAWWGWYDPLGHQRDPRCNCESSVLNRNTTYTRRINNWINNSNMIIPIRSQRVIDLSHHTGPGRVFSGFGIWLKYGAGIGKTINILTGSGIWLFPGKRDSPKIGHGMRDLCLRVGRECRKPSRPTGSSGQSESTRRALSGVSFQTKHPMECLVLGLNG